MILSIGLSWIIRAYRPKTPVPAKAGIDIRNEIFAASSLLKFNTLAPVIIIPDLLTPGISERIWKKPIITAFFVVKFFSMFLLALNLSAK